MSRQFRTPESYEAERITRDLIPAFLRSRGFRNVTDKRRRTGLTGSQTIQAISPTGENMVMRAKLCWRGRDTKRRFAVQLLAKIKNRQWEQSLQRFVERAKQEGCSHFLLVQREGGAIAAAASVPVSDLVGIWCAQRDISASLIANGGLGRRRKNHAMNGSSPTLWLEDDQAQAVTDALWKHPRVNDLTQCTKTELIGDVQNEASLSFDDTSGIDYSLLGSDGSLRLEASRMQIKRDGRVRIAVLKRAGGKCEREGCRASRQFSGFLDVHHIFGAENSDRVWNCVALCPNCHREAHASPFRDRINAALLQIAMRSKAARAAKASS